MSANISTVLHIDNVTVTYIDAISEHTAIRNLSLELVHGSWTAIIGNNGSGKSTLSKVIAGVCPITEGQRTLNPEYPVHILLQNPETQILGETIGEELRMNLPDPNDINYESILTNIMDEVGLPLPLDTRIATLSGGQKQLLNVASCMSARAKLLLFDEATSMLDPQSRGLVMHSAATLHSQGSTLVWVTHRMEELSFANRVLVLDQGMIVFDGSIEEFFYGQLNSDEVTPCERWGFAPPFVVQTARALQKLGHVLPSLPLNAQQLSQAVIKLCL
ncbi:hypothetical protein SY83_16965 [Paenibacillus swuensis]|uniref:ABC transporter domain-containing protein n=1 Tax=Paenibacillus swuensis TaxID=1178515 RepID=A0A172TKX9_9BACL|nr:ATP-binding cassette domain-containing protein [Paenibacillus swuensis]ANE47691.1 hypothetical protein SY83_16965 [Paenibacillus swuensis]